MTTYTRQTAADAAGVGSSTADRYVMSARALGCNPPGYMVDREATCTEEFVDWLRAEALKRKPRSVQAIARGEVAPPPTAEIVGLTPGDRLPDPSKIWKRVLEIQTSNSDSARRRYSQEIRIPGNLPVCIAFTSDWHGGNSYTDYARLWAETELVADTPGMYAITMGDLHDNWVGKLEGIQRYQPVSLAEELALVRDRLMRLCNANKLLACVSGNHESRADKLAGLDWIRDVLADHQVLYDQDEILATLTVGDAEWRLKLRHKWRYKSILNPFHGFWRDLERADDWDMAIGGHVHSGSHWAKIDHMDGGSGHPTDRYAVLLGTYEYDSKYARMEGYPRHVASGAVGVIYWPTGETLIVGDLQVAARALRAERGGA